MDTAKWPQEFVVKPMNEIVTNTCLKQSLPLPPPPPPPQTVGAVVGSTVERKMTRPQKEQALNCPRCNSIHTKFCYYNNYSLTQPRYFCKDCRRYWTEGGSLRNIPIGGGSRKNKRSSSSSTTTTTTSSSSSNSNSSPSKKQLFATQNPNLNEGKVQVQDLTFSQGLNTNPHEVKDLNLAFSQGFGIAEFLQVPSIKNNNNSNPLVSTSSALELLGISNSSGSSSIQRPSFIGFPHVNDPSSVYTPSGSGFGLSYPPFQEFMRPPTLGFSLDTNGGYNGEPLNQQEGSNSNINNGNNTNGIPLLPFESLKLPVSSSSTNSSGGGNDHHHHQQHQHDNHQEQQHNQGNSDHEEEKEEGGDQSVGFWSGMLGVGVGGGGAGATTASGGGTWQL